MKALTFVSLLICLLLFPLSLGAEESADRLLEEIHNAVDSSFYRKALSLIDHGNQLYPEDIRFPVEKGDLYRDQELYGMALESYRKAENLNPYDRDLREKLASVLAYLDRNYEALEYLEGLVDEGVDLMDDLGWMYYKTHKPEEGIERLSRALENEFDKNLSLTLGSLYADLNRVEECRAAYLDAIDAALEEGDSYFASVGYYNLSLAEKAFYDYEAAEEYALQSLDLMDRAGGHLALGDLYTMQLDFDRAAREFGSAASLDKTPLSRLSRASLNRLQGRLEDALRILDQISDSQDDSWMYYYGLNGDQFRMDLYHHYAEVYSGLFHRSRLFRVWGIRENLLRMRRLFDFGGKTLYYKLLYRLLSFREGALQYEGGSELRGVLTLAGGTEGYASLSASYYRRALALEDFDQARPWYDLVLGREERDPERLEKAARGFIPEWERQPIEEALRESWFLKSRRERNSSDLLSELFLMNPGSLIQYGLRLPVRLELSDAGPVLNRRLKNLLRRSGFTLKKEAALVLRFRGGENPNFTLSDRSGRILASGRVQGAGHDDLRSWVRGLRADLFLY